jgi:hypothetical protein
LSHLLDPRVVFSNDRVEYQRLQREVGDETNTEKWKILEETTADDGNCITLVTPLLSEGLRVDEDAMPWFVEVAQWVSFSCIRSC